MRRVAIIYNPVSGGSRGEAVSEAVEAALAEAGDEVTRAATRADTGAREVASELPPDVELVVAVGGDGTLKEAVDGLTDRLASVTLGVVPMGNANIVARDLGIGAGKRAAIDVLLSGTATTMDLGTVRMGDAGETFLAVVGIGWDAETVSRVDRWRRAPAGRALYRRWADGLYGAAGLASAWFDGGAPVTVSIDGEVMPGGDYHGVFVGNVHTFGKAMSVTPDADRASGALHVQARRMPGLVAIGRQLTAALRRRETSGRVSDYASGATVEVVGKKPFAVEVDGENRGRTEKLVATIRPGALRIMSGQPR